MSKIAVVTDSTAYLSQKEIEKLGIYTVPLCVNFGLDTFREDEDISIEEFFLKVRESEELPQSSQPAAGDFARLYEKLGKEYDAIISIHISSKLSGTFQTASSLSQDIKETKVYLVDSKATAEPQAYLVREAVRMVQEGKEAEEIVERLKWMTDKSETYFMVDDMTNLIKGGRVSKTVGNLATLLKIKPLLTFENGEIILAEKIRTKKKALNRIKSLLAEASEKSDYPLKASVVHVFDEENGKKVLAEFEKEFPQIAFNFAFVGPVIGTHVGEKTLGITWTIDHEKVK